MSSTEPSRATQAARLLLAVRRGAPRLAALPAALAPQSLAEAYAIQHELLREQGSGIAGWKASLFDAQHGICAPLPANAVRDAPAYLSPKRMPTLHTRQFGIEPEIAFTLGDDLRPLPAGERYERAAVCAAVATAHAAIEVVVSRYLDGEAVSQLERVADSFMNELLILGPSCRSWQQLDLAELPLEVKVDGKVVYQGHGGHPLGDPLLPLIWLANHLGQFGRGLRAGEVVTTGSCNGVRAVAPKQTVSAYFAGLGSAVVRF
jgi:2-keto-4-pentenoate hydratase